MLRFVAVLGLCALVIWEIYHPRRDLVRVGVDGHLYDDPAGGVLDGAADAVRPPRRPSSGSEAPVATAVG